MTNAIDYPSLGGFVLITEIFIGAIKTRKENPNGLFSEQIFGPNKLSMHMWRINWCHSY